MTAADPSGDGPSGEGEVDLAGGVTVCPSCGLDVAAGDEFCEACGKALHASVAGATSGASPSAAVGAVEPSDQSGRTHLIPAPVADAGGGATVSNYPPCASCGGVVGDDGWCTVCGARASAGREHVVDQPSPRMASVCDIGRQHARNEDAAAVSDQDRAVLVVCDGVTSATDSDAAAVAASAAACQYLTGAVPAAVASPGGRSEHWVDQLEEAGRLANTAAAEAATAVGTVENPPSCTLAAAVLDAGVIVAACVGDSRVYWFGDDGTAEQLTADDSWAAAQMAGGVPRARAEADPRAHAITRWLGVDSGAPVPSTSVTTVGSAGWLLACTDGLWNYCSDASDLAALVRASDSADHEPLALAEALVAWANEQGGHDNITAAVVRVEQTAYAEAADTDSTVEVLP